MATSVPPVEELEEPEEYLHDEGDIDYAKVPDIDLPPPLPSSKFAQNPELLKTLNRGGKRKFDQLIGWSDGGASDRTSKNHQPVFGGSMTEDSQSSDTDVRYGSGVGNSPFLTNQDEDLRRMMASGDNRGDHGRGDEDLRFNISGGPGRPQSGHMSEYEMRNSFGDKDFRHLGAQIGGFGQKSSLDGSGDHYGDRDRERDRERDGRSRWDDENMLGCGSSGSGDGPSRNNFDKRDGMPPGMGASGHMGSVGLMPNHHNMQNINPNMPPPMPPMVPHPSMSGHPSMQNKNNSGMMPAGMMDGPMPHMMHHPNIGPPNFGPNGPPPPNSGPGFGPNFRPPNGNFGPNQHFRPNPMAPFGPNPPPGAFINNFQGPPNFRGPNPGNSGPPNFDRSNFGPNFRGQSQMSGGPNGGGGFGAGGFGNNFSGNGGGGGNGNGGGHNKNGPNRGMNRSSNDNNASGRNNYNNRGGRGRDGDQSRGSRLRDNY